MLPRGDGQRHRRTSAGARPSPDGVKPYAGRAAVLVTRGATEAATPPIMFNFAHPVAANVDNPKPSCQAIRRKMYPPTQSKRKRT